MEKRPITTEAAARSLSGIGIEQSDFLSGGPAAAVAGPDLLSDVQSVQSACLSQGAVGHSLCCLAEAHLFRVRRSAKGPGLRKSIRVQDVGGLNFISEPHIFAWKVQVISSS